LSFCLLVAVVAAAAVRQIRLVLLAAVVLVDSSQVQGLSAERLTP
jgi:hypothetical protein